MFEVEICDTVLQALKSLFDDRSAVDGGACGIAIGTCSGNSWTVYNSCSPRLEDCSFADAIDEVSITLPGGLNVLGPIWIENDEISDTDFQSYFEAFRQTIGEGDKPLQGLVVPKAAILCGDAQQNIENVEAFILSEGSDLRTPVKLRKQADLMNKSVMIHCCGSLPCSVEIKDDESLFFDECQRALQTVIDSKLGDKRLAFILSKEDCTLIVTEDQVYAPSDTKLSTLTDFCHSNPDCRPHVLQSRRCKFSGYVRAQFVEKSTGSSLVKKLMSCVPLVDQLQRPHEVVQLQLRLDSIAICHKDATMDSVYVSLRTALERQLKSAFHCFSFFSSPKTREFYPPVPCFFHPKGLTHPLCVHYPATLNDDTEKLSSLRQRLHSIWNLPSGFPIFRSSNAILTNDICGGRLLNIHQSVPPLPAKEYSIACVDGDYLYCHYMQDSFNDNGWGCAYRSYQSIWSWFLLQGYTIKPIPNHASIQQSLVDVGDKAKEFVGSRKWIGSLELSFCLSYMLNVESKVLSVSCGSELPSKARELLQHFRSQGTPVMIGGGVLAHSILGVAFNPETGDCMFLVLDPHYTGDDVIGPIISKGWCGWKPVTFWAEDAFYNLLLPQRPVLF